MGINWWLWERNLVSDMGLRSVQMLRQGGILYRLVYREGPCIMKCTWVRPVGVALGG